MYDLFPDATFVSTPNNDTALPFATGTRTDCNWYIKGSDFQEDWAGSMFLSNCDAVAALYGAGLNALGTWNPSLGDTGLPSCKFDPAYQYCALLPESAGTPSAPTIPPVPIRVGLAMLYCACDDQDADSWTWLGWRVPEVHRILPGFRTHHLPTAVGFTGPDDCPVLRLQPSRRG